MNEADDFLNLPNGPRSPERTSGYEEPREQVGAVVAGRYKLLEQIGEGGMGAVWMAEQRTPVKRLVGLKLIKAGMDSKAVLARFEAERQALALMDHPNIAKVLDGGTTEQGRPYFAMELVKGLPLTEYCDSRRLRVTDRLELFIQVCAAVQHAHQKGIIHRDLKPSNVLVTEHDGVPVPKVIDFGLAKALHGSSMLTDRTLHTAYGAVVGTPLYMAPEQVGINALDVDTRTDIYALGVILYELLTGTTPLEKQRFKEAAWEEMRRVIREEEPQRPSTRLSSSGSLPNLAAQRQTEPAKLSKLIRGELDWIVLKALEKDRNRRYETANGFALDVKRFLDGEPVLAVPPSASYRLRKFVRKHRAGLTTAVMLVTLLITAAVFSGWQAIRATTAQQEAEAAAKSESEQRGRAEQAERLATERLTEVSKEKQRADQEAHIARAVNDFLQEDLFGGAGDWEQAERGYQIQVNLTLKEAMHRSANRIADRFKDQPLVEAGIRRSIGQSLACLGEPYDALPHLERSLALRESHLGADHVVTLKTLEALAFAHLRARHLEKAVAMLEKVVARLTLGADHSDTVESMVDLGEAYRASGKLDRALDVLGQAYRIAREKLDPTDRARLLCTDALFSAALEDRQFDRAIALAEEGIAITSDRRNNKSALTPWFLWGLVLAYEDSGRMERAIPRLEELVRDQKVEFGPDHPSTQSAMNYLGEAYNRSGKHDQALVVFEEILQRRRVRPGPYHPDTVEAMHQVAWVHERARRYDVAIPQYEEILKLRKATVGPDDQGTLTTQGNLVKVYQGAGKPALALALLEETFNRRREKLGPNDSRTLASMKPLGEGYAHAGKFDRAIAVLEEALQRRKETLGLEHVDTLDSMHMVAWAYDYAKQYDLAIQKYQDTLKLKMSVLGPLHKETEATRRNLIVTYQRAGKPELALPLLEETFNLRKAKYGADHVDTLKSMDELATAYVRAGNTEKALALFEEVLLKRKQILGLTAPDTLHSMHQVAWAHENAGSYDIAIAKYEETLKLRKPSQGALNPHTLITQGNLIRLYYRTGNAKLALPLLEETLNLRKAKHGADHVDTLKSMDALAQGHQEANNYELALPLFEETLRKRRALLGVDHADTLDSMVGLAVQLFLMEQRDRARSLLEEAISIETRKFGADDSRTLDSKVALGILHVACDRPAEAIPLLKEAWGTRKKHSELAAEAGPSLLSAYIKTGKRAEATALSKELLDSARKDLKPDSPELGGFLATTGRQLLQLGSVTDAEPILRECLTLRMKLAPEAWNTHNAKSLLGGALLVQKKYAEAEPLLVAGYEGLKLTEATIPPQGENNLPNALERLVQLYEATGKPDEAAKWRKELATRLADQFHKDNAWPLLWGWPRF